MPLDAYLSFVHKGKPKYKGDSTDNLCKDEIAILSFEQTINRTLTHGKDDDKAKGTAVLGVVTVIKPLDKVTPKLMEATCRGHWYDKAIIKVCQPSAKSSGQPADWTKATMLEILLEHVYVRRVRLVGDPSMHLPVEPARINVSAVASIGPLEEVDLSFAKITWTYNGSVDAKLTGTWDLTTNS